MYIFPMTGYKNDPTGASVVLNLPLGGAILYSASLNYWDIWI